MSACCDATEVLVETLMQAAQKPGSVPAAELLSAVCNLDKKKAPLPENWYQLLSRPDKRWRLIYTAGAAQRCLQLYDAKWPAQRLCVTRMLDQDVF